MLFQTRNGGYIRSYAQSPGASILHPRSKIVTFLRHLICEQQVGKGLSGWFILRYGHEEIRIRGSSLPLNSKFSLGSSFAFLARDPVRAQAGHPASPVTASARGG